MLARRRSITHPTAGEIELPLLVPAFSSKGFVFIKPKGKPEFSEISYLLDQFLQSPISHILISAYDLHFNHYDATDLNKSVYEALGNTRFVFLDSGGYELSSDFDSTEPKRFTYQPKHGFGKDEYLKTINLIKKKQKKISLIITNYDHDQKGVSFVDQIIESREFFNEHSNFLSDFLIKPWSKTGKYITPSKLSPDELKELKSFDIIGVTEKELGSDLITRLRGIADLRKRLDDVGVGSPIHIWGGLDPVITPLYFFAGAEIFDGVSWLRYAYINGMAVNRDSFCILKKEAGVETSKYLNDVLSGHHNLLFLNNLTSSLQQWVDYEGKKFDMFDVYIRESLKKSYATLRTKITGIEV